MRLARGRHHAHSRRYAVHQAAGLTWRPDGRWHWHPARLVVGELRRVRSPDGRRDAYSWPAVAFALRPAAPPPAAARYQRARMFAAEPFRAPANGRPEVAQGDGAYAYRGLVRSDNVTPGMQGWHAGT